MKFDKEFLIDLAYAKDVPVVDEQIVGHSRWSIEYEQIFEHGGKFYRTSFSKGATEYQDEQPYEYDEDKIECQEVVPVEKVVTVYENILSKS